MLDGFGEVNFWDSYRVAVRTDRPATEIIREIMTLPRWVAASHDSTTGHEKGYPHNFKLFNLCRMRAVGVEKWAENEASEIRDLYFNGRFVVGDRPVKI